MIKENLERIIGELLPTTKLVAVSKTKPISAIIEAYSLGQRIFGENKVQELCDKMPELPKDIQWHLIGHLQSNKVKYIAPFVSLIHSIDTFKLLMEVNKQALKCNRIIDCLIQFHIAEEESKFGFDLQEVATFLGSTDYSKLKNIRVVGVMGMATNTSNLEQVRKEFKQLNEYASILKNDFFSHENSFNEISMGMSGDYQIAMEEGSTLVRIGSSIFN